MKIKIKFKIMPHLREIFYPQAHTAEYVVHYDGEYNRLMFKLQQENWKERKQQQKFTTKIGNVRRFWRSDSMLMFFFFFFPFRIWRSRVFSLCLCLCSAKCDLPVFLSYIHPKDRLGKGSISPDCTSHKQYQLYSSSAHLHIVQ